MLIKVAKFGGTSLSDDKQFMKVRDIIKSDISIKYVVASAPGSSNRLNTKITDLLYLCYEYKKNNINYKEIFYEISERFNKIVGGLKLSVNIKAELRAILDGLEDGCSEDYFVSRGEYLNSIILAEYIGFEFIDAMDIIFFDENGLLDIERTYSVLSKLLRKKQNLVIPGFYGSCMGHIKTFSRGGSDITGSIIAKAANVDIYENWTDVSGLMMADPRIITHPKKIDIMTYRELRELAYMGATVLHDEAVFPVREAKIPINIRNTNQPNECGTLIVENIEDEEDNDGIITGISGKKNYTVFCINKAQMAGQIGIMKTALDIFHRRKIAIEHVPTGIDSFSVIVSSSSVEGVVENISDELKLRCNADDIVTYTDLALITSVGRNIRNKSAILKRLFSALEREGIDIKIIGQGLSDINIIMGVDNKDFEDTIKAIYDEFVM